MDRNSGRDSGIDVIGGLLASSWALSFLWHLGPLVLNPQTGGLDLPWWGAAYYGTTLGMALGVFLAVGTTIDWLLTKADDE